MAATGSAEGASALTAWIAPDDRITFAVIGVLILGLLIICSIVNKVLKPKDWSLADALSEEADVTVPDPNISGVPYTVNGVVVKKTVLAASSSRLIAFIGTIAILFLFLGFGVFMLWGFAKTGNVPTSSVDSIKDYLLAGLTLFAPYMVNKFSSVFSSK